MQVKLLMIFLTFLLPGLTSSVAQDSINATGKNATGDGGSVSYSVGQMTYQTFAGNNGKLTQGIQQPYEILVVTDVEGIDLSLAAFPNPTEDFLILSIDKIDFSQTSYQLFDKSGKLISNHDISGSHTSIMMSHLSPSLYILKVVRNGNEIKIFKIIKK